MTFQANARLKNNLWWDSIAFTVVWYYGRFADVVSLIWCGRHVHYSTCSTVRIVRLLLSPAATSNRPDKVISYGFLIELEN